MIEKNNSRPIAPEVQLAYVLPRPSLKLLPSEFHEILLKEKGEHFVIDGTVACSAQKMENGWLLETPNGKFKLVQSGAVSVDALLTDEEEQTIKKTKHKRK